MRRTCAPHLQFKGKAIHSSWICVGIICSNSMESTSGRLAFQGTDGLFVVLDHVAIFRSTRRLVPCSITVRVHMLKAQYNRSEYDLTGAFQSTCAQLGKAATLGWTNAVPHYARAQTCSLDQYLGSGQFLYAGNHEGQLHVDRGGRAQSHGVSPVCRRAQLTGRGDPASHCYMSPRSHPRRTDVRTNEHRSLLQCSRVFTRGRRLTA